MNGEHTNERVALVADPVDVRAELRYLDSISFYAVDPGSEKYSTDSRQARKVRERVIAEVDRLTRERNAYMQAMADHLTKRSEYRTKIEALERGEFICKQCGLRKDGEKDDVQF